MISRAERSLLGDWWWTVDRAMLFGLAVLMISGLVFLMAGGPPVAERLGLSTFHFVTRQVVYLAPAVMLLFAVSFLSLRLVRRVALFVYFVGIALCILAIQYGPEIKGAHRWINIAGIGLQPSEFVKPAFVILTAWAFAEGSRRKDMPGALLALLLLPMTIGPLILQPDFGQTMLVTMVWCGLVFIAGLHWFWLLGLGAMGMVGVGTAYTLLPHVRGRFERFLDKSGTADNYQAEMARRAFDNGGWFGVGPGEGSAKRLLPDSHTDYIFATTGEEFGILVCLGIVAVFALILLRGFALARRNEDAFCRLATAGLLMMFGLQAAINMAVNTNLMPAKGMTLPFISYGGSSLISLALGMGFLIALTRRRPRAEMFERSSLA